MEKPEINDYYIAYFDLLGYKDFFIKTPDKVQDFLSLITNGIENTKKIIMKMNDSKLINNIVNVSFKYKIFSDNIILCVKVGNTDKEILRILTFLSTIADIQRAFVANYGLFLRGGILKGKIAITDDFVFGEGLINAVQMEATAIYPRIVISDDLVKYLNSSEIVSEKDVEWAKSINDSKNLDDIGRKRYTIIGSKLLMQNVYLKWINCMIWKSPDNKFVISYLELVDVYNMFEKDFRDDLFNSLKNVVPFDYEINNEIPQSLKYILGKHQYELTNKISEFGECRNDCNDIKSEELREKILKKYLWVCTYHNSICYKYKLLFYMIELEILPELTNYYMTARIVVRK